MKIAVLGTGRMGEQLAQLWAGHGHEIYWGSRDMARAVQMAAALGDNVRGAGLAQAAELADIVTLTIPWYALTDVQRAVGDLQGKIIIDCINPLMSSGSLALGHKTSAAEEIARQFPLAHVVKAFNGIYYENLARPRFGGRPASLFYCSDVDRAKVAVHQLAEEMGFAPVDCGPLKHARYLEPLAALWIQMAFHMGLGPEMAFTLVEREA